MSMFNVFTVSMSQVEELGAKDLVAFFKPFHHDPIDLYEQVNDFASRLELDDSEVNFFITDLKCRYQFTEGSLAYSIAFALAEYAETVYRQRRNYEKREERLLPYIS